MTTTNCAPSSLDPGSAGARRPACQRPPPVTTRERRPRLAPIERQMLWRKQWRGRIATRRSWINFGSAFAKMAKAGLVRLPPLEKWRGPGLARPPPHSWMCIRRRDQLPFLAPVPSGLRYCCRKTMMHPGPVVRPFLVVVLPQSLAPFPVKSPAGSPEY
jgi:hypothetical protein